MRAIARGRNLRISTKDSIILCERIRGLRLEKAKNFLKNLIDKKASINGKYYTNTAKQILQLLEQAEANARIKNLNIDKLFVQSAKADKGIKILRYGRIGLKRGRGFRRGKSTHVEITLVEK
jgi:ribosomal protein L22